MKKEPTAPTKQPTRTSRRQFVLQSSKLVSGVALAGVALPWVHAAEDNTIRLALIGSGNRGSGAVRDAMEANNSPVKLFAMADLFQNRLFTSHQNLVTQFGDRVDVPTERQFIGFDAYRQAIDSLRPRSGDVAMLTTYPGFRVVHLEYAIKKGVNVFMEKSFAVDPAGLQRVLRAGEEADKKGIKIAAGLMCRHSVARQEFIKKLRAGELGNLQLVRAYRMEAYGAMGPRKADDKDSELIYQIRNRTRFFWVSGGIFGELSIHQIDECCWLNDGWPVTAQGWGGRAVTNTDCGQDLDNYFVEYTFANGAKALVCGRYIPKCETDFATYVHAAKCAGQFSGNIHAATVQIYRDQRIAPDNIAWKAAKEPCTPWQAEWNVLIDNIRNNRPQNEAKRAAFSNAAYLMGRAAVHMGRTVTWEEIMNSKFQFCPNIDTLTLDSPAPVHADAQGRYPVPVPGKWQEI